LIRRDWRALAIAIGVTSAITGVSFVLDPAQWARWLDLLRTDSVAAGAAAFDTEGWYVPIALGPRLVAAGAVVVVAAALGRRSLVPIGVVLAMPVVWLNSLAVLTACVPLWIEDRLAAALRATVASANVVVRPA
jgi:hypothetical protein